MRRKSTAVSIGGPGVAVVACLLLAGCGGGSSATSAAGDRTVCTSFAQAYSSFLGGATPSLQAANSWDELIAAAGRAIGPSIPSGGVSRDIFDLMNDATDASENLTYHHPVNQDVARFNSNLEKVGKDCGKTFTPATAS
jgi:hypothetical protein